ncbi:2OG-Fe(II) oxygenase [Nodosilinea sp. LEGE 07088]|uniref:2OG-Fe(II) oxygenase n=1 Tax=Nodosilinea sp. LEGE 07088 TaxID=2777968 RepID=UPI001882C64B|nr:2OG-Fe(II) oxygenase [Nodosilinea sp. LEGE 07088]MBE9137145.1 2OG-Fe(II) oxygenase [Nodosilinea sp. LEGE 07088]
MPYYRCQPEAFSTAYLHNLRGGIQACRYFATNNLNRDFVATKGFSVVFTRSGRTEVERQFPFFKPYLDRALLPDCNAFYLNPLLLNQGSRVDPHIDRSLRSYCKTIEPPDQVSVLYVQVPADLSSGELVLQQGRRRVAQIRPQPGLLLHFQGDLTHSINAMVSGGSRLSLVCEQYALDAKELEDIPGFLIESRAIAAAKTRR